ncbi:MAG: cytochrome C biogenesis protein [Coriobacteriaceae bacterium]|nr:cytochrome C biogenesis protein [Coriobacteriaceae bacterium]
MNKRAQVRLIGVTAIIVIAVAAILLGTAKKEGAIQKGVAEIAADTALVGQRVKVGGSVVPGSWDKKSNPMRFEIREEGASGGPTLKVVYSGQVPSTFGDDVAAIITGTLQEGGLIEATDMITKCPSKYESATGAETVDVLLANGAKIAGKPIKVTGFVVTGSIKPPGGGERFRIAAKAAGGNSVGVVYEGALPDGMADASSVVLGGSLGTDGVFTATSVAISK